MSKFDIHMYDGLRLTGEILRLPKQFPYWIEKVGLRPEYRPSRARREYGPRAYWTGRGRRWRINARGMFECTESLVTFDRWANSNIASFDARSFTCYESFRIIFDHMLSLRPVLDSEIGPDDETPPGVYGPYRW